MKELDQNIVSITVTFPGDMSVGIQDYIYEVQAPFHRSDIDDICDEELTNREAFRKDLATLYESWGDGRPQCMYDDELRKLVGAQVCPACKETHNETDCQGYCSAACLQGYSNESKGQLKACLSYKSEKDVLIWLAKNPKPGDRVYFYPNGRVDKGVVEETTLIEQTTEDTFRCTTLSCLHVSNMWVPVS